MSSPPLRPMANTPPPAQPRTVVTTTVQQPTVTTTTTLAPGAAPVTNTTITPPRVTPTLRRVRPQLFTSNSNEEVWRNQSTIRVRRPVSPNTQADRRGSTARPGPPNVRLQRLRPSTSAEPVERQRRGSVGGSNLRHETRLEPDVGVGRRRSSSDPNRAWNQTHDATGALRTSDYVSYLPEVTEGVATPSGHLGVPGQESGGRTGIGRRLSAASQLIRLPSFRPSSAGKERESTPDIDTDEDQYHADMIDVLDTVDPEISTLNTLNNVQNSLFVPDLGRYINRRPTYTLTRYTSRGTITTVPDMPAPTEEPELDADDGGIPERTATITSLTSRLDDDHFAVLPHGERLHGWTKAERDELNDHVRHLLHSRKEKFRRGMKGFGQYVRRPLGFFVTLYATLITLFGLAWVLFLIGWINVGGKKDYVVNVIDNILVALFAIMGDGLAPFRAVDTYHMIFIAHYHHLTWKLRKQRSLPKLTNQNDLPGLAVNQDAHCMPDIEAEEKMGEMSVLTPQQQKKLVHHQKKFSRSHTFYKPHETETHFAFPLRILVAVVCLLDCHSLFQIALGTCTWAISYHTRPFALTTVILCCSITCNITAGVLISIGDHKTRKKDVLERMFRQELTAQAIHTLEKRREQERQRNQALEMDQIDESEHENPNGPKDETSISPAPTSPATASGALKPRSVIPKTILAAGA